ncbi:hypothetical protein EDD90_7372 [Streptomyces sp. Ag109_O5-1]|uniref:hypothetical protein n=1 Tax=Streptomyces sp. Ag109_O5-1 TaxID=1938851 RepID=UPI000F983130|nr:hypothetical protein [Streptomyces sp. Ag109_O5-1]RPE44142.1 hypothetical protein EDD90_7372 [Streptomyces sp. Ag109_O5-1]
MRALLAGALLGLLLLFFPSVVTLIGAVLVAAAVKAVPHALLLALLARTVAPRMRRWAR